MAIRNVRRCRRLFGHRGNVIVLNSRLNGLRLYQTLDHHRGRLGVGTLMFARRTRHFGAIVEAIGPRSSVGLVRIDGVKPSATVLLRRGVSTKR